MRAANSIELVVRDTSVRERSVRFTAVVALATLLVGGRAATLAEGADMAAAAIDSGRAAGALDALVAITAAKA